MQIVINIPKEFEEHFGKDGFRESLQRLKADAICVAGNYERELCNVLEEAFGSATVLPAGCGRLIDADLLVKQYGLDDAPTVVGKEEVAE